MTDLLDDDTLLDLRRRAKATDPAAVIAEERARRTTAVRPVGPIESGAAPPPSTASPATSEPSASPQAGPATCAICGTGKARDRCTMCGRPACAADLWVMLRLCRACADERAVARGQRGAKPEDANWLERR